MTNTDLSVGIIGYEHRYAEDFARLNYEWLEQYFTVEPHDREMLDHPYQYIIQTGGHILFARVDEQIVGTVALIRDGEKACELAKMAVKPNFKGLKIGRKLMDAAIDHARKNGNERIWLESNTGLTPAINLYISAGFRAAPLDPKTPYARCNIRMELKLN